MINLVLAGIWLLLAGVVMWLNPWRFPAEQTNFLGGVAVILSLYNLVRWRMQVMMRRGTQLYQDELRYRRREPKEIDPTFDFSDPRGERKDPPTDSFRR